MSPATKKRKKKKREEKDCHGGDSSKEKHVPRSIIDTSMGEMPERQDKEGRANDAEIDGLSKLLDRLNPDM
jgi:hypothetical protein